MNAILVQINSTGKIFVEFALPMFVQSSVLILILLLTDFALRKKVRAVFRYGIWLLVLIKLVLPTSLSAPLSLGYFFGDGLAYVDISRTAIETETMEPTQAIVPPFIDLTNIKTYRQAPTVPLIIPETEPAVTEPINSPVVSVTPVTWQGAVFLAWLTVVMAMGLLLLQRAFFVRGLVTQAKDANGLMADTLESCRGSMGVKRKIGLKVSANATSPAVCGLFRPVILVPQNLTSSLSKSQLRAVMLHELAHIRRGDLWVNLAQTVLQIIYFYNPLLWLANCIIRRVREQAVDEMVLVAMGEAARQYPQTLVNVAKMAFKRPVLSLRLIGVVESKSALAGRIKHILNRPMPKKAKLGILGLAVVIVIAAILLPMATCTPGPPSLVIKGVVKDAQTGKPIAGARVFDDGYGPKPDWEQIKADVRSEWGAITNSAGEYSFLTWPEHHSIKIEAPGYKAERRSLYSGHFVFNKKDQEVFDFALVQVEVETDSGDRTGKPIPPEVQREVERLKADDPVVRVSAAKKLGEMGEKAVSAIPFLIEALTDNGAINGPNGHLFPEPQSGKTITSDDMPGYQAAKALGRIGQPGVEPLIDAIKNHFRASSFGNIQHMADQYGPEHIGNRWLWNAEIALSEIGSSAVEQLIAVLDDNDRLVRIAATWALGRIGDPRAVKPLALLLKDPDKYVRGGAAFALGCIGDKRALEPLTLALNQDEDWHVRRKAATGLGQLDDKRAVEPLIAAMRRDDEIRGAIYRQGMEEDVRRSAARSLGWLGDERAVEPLIEALSDEDIGLRIRVVYALGRIGNIRATEPLINALSEPEEGVRRAAKSALDKIKAKYATTKPWPRKYEYSKQVTERWRSWWQQNEDTQAEVDQNGKTDVQVDDEAAWGKPIEDAQIRLLNAVQIWGRSDWPHPSVQIRLWARNEGERYLHLPENGLSWQIEVDGLWYEWVATKLHNVSTDARETVISRGGRLLDFNPGDSHAELTVDIASNWWQIPNGKQEEYARRRWFGWAGIDDEYGRELVFKSGLHRVRVAVTCPPSRAGHYSPVRLVSNPLKIAITEIGGNAPFLPDEKYDVQVEGEKPQSLIFHGLDLTAVPHTTNSSKLPDLFEERPLDSKSYHIQKDVTAIYSGLDGTVYFIPGRNIFYVQHDKLGSSTLTYYGPFEGNPVQVLNLQPNVQIEVDESERLKRSLREDDDLCNYDLGVWNKPFYVLSHRRDDWWVAYDLDFNNKEDVWVKLSKLGFTTEADPQEVFEKAGRGDVCMPEPNVILTLRGTIMVPINVPKRTWLYEQLFGRITRMKVGEILEQIRVYRSTHTHSQTQQFRVMPDQCYALLRPDGLLVAMEICGPQSNLWPQFVPLGFVSAHKPYVRVGPEER